MPFGFGKKNDDKEQVAALIVVIITITITILVSITNLYPVYAQNDISLIAVRPVQAPLNPDVLVEGKKTGVEVDVTSSFPESKDTVVRVLASSPLAFPQVHGYPLTVEPGSHTYYVPKDAFLADCCAISPIPPTTCIAAQLDPENVLKESNEDNNDIGTNCPPESIYPVENSQQYSVLFLPLRLVGEQSQVSITSSEMEVVSLKISNFIQGAFPIDEDDFVSGFFPYEFRVRKPVNLNDYCKIGNESINKKMEVFRFLPLIFGIPIVYDDVVGLVKRTGVHTSLPGTGGSPGIACPENNVHAVTVLLNDDQPAVNDAAPTRVAHEIAHVYNWAWNFCTEETPITCADSLGHISLPAPGYWVEEGREMIKPSGEPERDFMNPESNDKWISRHTFDYLHDRLKTSTGASQIITVRGSIFNNNTVTLDPWYKLNYTEYYPLNSMGNYTLSYVDDTGNEIAQTGFDVTFESEIGTKSNHGYFSVNLPSLPDAHKIVIMNGTKKLAERVLSSDLPKVQITSPNGGELFKANDTIRIRWDSFDTDQNDNLTHAVALSIDEGKTWFPISAELKDTEFMFVAPPNITTESAMIKVAVNDGINTVYDITDSPFSLIGSTVGN